MEIFYLDINNFPQAAIDRIIESYPSGSSLKKRQVEFALGRFLVFLAGKKYFINDIMQGGVKE